MDRLKRSVDQIDRFYLAGGSAIAFHLQHRRSNDLDLFGPARASFAPFQAMSRADPSHAQIVQIGEATLQMEIGGVPVDVVRYPYPLLERAAPGPVGFPTAGLLDLATNKLAAIAKRGLRRDFWDLYAIAQSGLSLATACDAYVERFGVTENDLYHVMIALTWFEQLEDVYPAGMTHSSWAKIQAFFENEVPKLVLGRDRKVRPTRPRGITRRKRTPK